MNPDGLSKKLADIKSLEQFFELAGTLRHWGHPELFSVLFAIASDCTAYPASYSAAANLLLALEPRCPLTCREAIERLGHGHFDASLKRLPFYLVAQFGRPQVSKEAEALLADPSMSDSVRDAARLVKYWAQYPASKLIGFPWHEWEQLNSALKPD